MKPKIHSRILNAFVTLAVITFTLGLSSAACAQVTETIVANFSGNFNSVGSATQLARDSAGNLYGASGNSVFKLSRAANGIWKQTILHTFSCCPGLGGGGPTGVILDAAGNLYGTTLGGGILKNCHAQGSGLGCGVMLELSTTRAGGWTPSLFCNFPGEIDGPDPNASLVLD